MTLNEVIEILGSNAPTDGRWIHSDTDEGKALIEDIKHSAWDNLFDECIGHISESTLEMIENKEGWFHFDEEDGILSHWSDLKD